MILNFKDWTRVNEAAGPEGSIKEKLYAIKPDGTGYEVSPKSVADAKAGAGEYFEAPMPAKGAFTLIKSGGAVVGYMTQWKDGKRLLEPVKVEKQATDAGAIKDIQAEVDKQKALYMQWQKKHAVLRKGVINAISADEYIEAKKGGKLGVLAKSIYSADELDLRKK